MVTMARKLTFGPTMADWQERVDVNRLREARQERARSIMRKHGIAAVLAAEAPGVRYLTGLRCAPLHQTTYVLFFAEHEPVMFAHAGWYQQMPEEAPWIVNWRISRSWFGGIAGPSATGYEATLFARDVREELEVRGLTAEKLGLIAFDGVAKEALQAEGLHVVDAWPLMLEMRAIKTPDEITCFKLAAAMCTRAYQRLWEELRPGLTDVEANQIAANALYESGADNVWVATRSGPLSFERAYFASGRILEYGDILYVNLCRTQFLGYAVCLYRTFVLGRQPTDKERGWYNQVRDRLDAVIEGIKPGMTTDELANSFPPASTWGYKDEAEVLTVEWAHGIGLHELYDMPVINRQWSMDHPQVLEPGMVMAAESLEGEHKVGGARLEHMFVITENGAEVLDHFKRDEILVAGT